MADRPRRPSIRSRTAPSSSRSSCTIRRGRVAESGIPSASRARRAARSAARSARPVSSVSGATCRRLRSSTRSAAAARRLAADGRRLTNVVFMGMGEPLLNLDRVLEAVTALADPDRFGLGARHITVSTSGVVPGIRRLTGLGPQFTLAVSLHAARDPLRDVLVPLNRRWPVAEVRGGGARTRRGHRPADQLRVHDDLGGERHDARRRGAGDGCCAATSPTSTSSR